MDISYLSGMMESVPFGNLLIFSSIAYVIIFNFPTLTATYKKLGADKNTPVEVLYFVSWFQENSVKLILIAVGYLLGIVFDLLYLGSKIVVFGWVSYALILLSTVFICLILLGSMKGIYKIDFKIIKKRK